MKLSNNTILITGGPAASGTRSPLSFLSAGIRRGVDVRFEKENLTFTGEDSPMSHLLLSVMGAFRPVRA